MRPFSKITLRQRKGYREVFIYYSRHGVKFRESTNVKIIDQDVFDLEGTLTENSNLEIIRKTHRQVEDVILRYIRDYKLQISFSFAALIVMTLSRANSNF